MKRKVISMALAICMVAGMAGCGSKTEEPAQQPAPAQEEAPKPEEETPAAPEEVTPEAVKLTVWSPSEDQDPEYGQWLNTMCDLFNKEHPEWDITFEYGVSSESEAKKLVPQDIDAAADVFLFGSTGLENLCSANCLTEWGGSYKETVESNYPESLVNCLIYDGAYMASHLQRILILCITTRAYSQKRILNHWIPCWRRGRLHSRLLMAIILQHFILETDVHSLVLKAKTVRQALI